VASAHSFPPCAPPAIRQAGFKRASRRQPQKNPWRGNELTTACSLPKSKKAAQPRRARLRRFYPFGWRLRAHFIVLRECPNRHSFYAIALPLAQ
jgi:hypothetical protein